MKMFILRMRKGVIGDGRPERKNIKTFSVHVRKSEITADKWLGIVPHIACLVSTTSNIHSLCL